MHSACEREAVIYVTDLRAMVAFYAQGLGFTATDVQDSHAVLAADAWTLQLVRVPAEVAAAIRVTRPPRRRSGVPVKLAFPVADIDALGSELERLGGRLDPDETRRGFGDRLRRDAVEPEGNVIQLLAPGQVGGASQWRWERRLAQRFGFADPTSSRRTR